MAEIPSIGTMSRHLAQFCAAPRWQGLYLISEQCGSVALMFAAEADACEMVRLLVDKGATVRGACNAYGFTPLLHAVKGGSLGSVETLVGRGADVNDALESTDENAGTTALMYAAGKKSLPRVEFLVARGAPGHAA